MSLFNLRINVIHSLFIEEIKSSLRVGREETKNKGYVAEEDIICVYSVIAFKVF